MFDADAYLEDLITACRAAFGERLKYVGLQGSYLRGEATPDSDIDVMIILDRFCVRDMDAYRNILKKIGWYEKSCGFICGRDEMRAWNPLEVCQLLHTTKDLHGRLSDYLPRADREDELCYVRLSLGNLYHEICHRYIHADRERNAAKLGSAYKTLFFVIQNLHYLESGSFVLTKRELVERIPDGDREVLLLAERFDGTGFDAALECLFSWMQNAFSRLDACEGDVTERKEENTEGS